MPSCTAFEGDCLSNSTTCTGLKSKILRLTWFQMIQTAEKSIPCFFRCVFFFCSLIHPRPSKRSYRTRQKAKINKHRGQFTCPRAQPHFQIRLAPKFQDGVGNTELHRQSRSFEETDRSEIERKSTCSIIELLLSEAFPGYDLLKMTIVLIRSSGIWTRREVNTGNIPFTTSSKREG